MKQGRIIRTDGTTEDVQAPEFNLTYLQKVVGGYIQVVSTKENKEMVVNEEGMIDNLPINHAAYEELHSKYKPPIGCTYNIHGDVFIFLKGRLS